MGFLVFFVFLFIWLYRPVKNLGKERQVKTKWLVGAVLLTAIPGFAVIIGFEFLGGYLMQALSLQGVLKCLFDAFITAALIEEGFKYLIARPLLKPSQAQRRIDVIFMFMAVGLGFEIIESLLGLFTDSTILVGLIRGVFCSHVFWQMYMGAHYYDYRAAKAQGDKRTAHRELARALLVPFFLHGMNDFSIFFLETQIIEEGEEFVPGPYCELALIIFLVYFVANIVFMVRTLKMVNREATHARIEAEEARAALALEQAEEAVPENE